jgi:hypothetical protein
MSLSFRAGGYVEIVFPIVADGAVTHGHGCITSVCKLMLLLAFRLIQGF